MKHFLCVSIFFLIMLSDISYGGIAKSLFFSGISCALYEVFFYRHRPQSRFKVNFKLMKYLVWLLKEVFLSAIIMSKIILLGKSVKPLIKNISTNMSQLSNVKYANSITLTPGTITLEMGDKSFVVHSVTSEHYKDLKDGKMERKINKIEE